MKVLLLGAGASKAACYPLASQLMEAVQAEVEGPSHRDLLVSKDWAKWQLFKDLATGATRELLAKDASSTRLGRDTWFEISGI